jgi:hypothetical protein
MEVIVDAAALNNAANNAALVVEARAAKANNAHAQHAEMEAIVDLQDNAARADDTILAGAINAAATAGSPAEALINVLIAAVPAANVKAEVLKFTNANVKAFWNNLVDGLDATVFADEAKKLTVHDKVKEAILNLLDETDVINGAKTSVVPEVKNALIEDLNVDLIAKVAHDPSKNATIKKVLSVLGLSKSDKEITTALRDSESQTAVEFLKELAPQDDTVIANAVRASTDDEVKALSEPSDATIVSKAKDPSVDAKVKTFVEGLKTVVDTNNTTAKGSLNANIKKLNVALKKINRQEVSEVK